MAVKIKTCDRILEAASTLFAEWGYERVTIQMISESAGVNIAAVNYHYGSKENLYTAVWRAAFERCRIRFFSFIEEEGLCPEERLRAFVSGRVQAGLCEDEDGCFSKIMYREMVEPTFARDAIEEEVILPSLAWLTALFRELLGEEAEEETVRHLTFSTISQCAFIALHRHFHAGQGKAGGACLPALDPEAVSTHISDLILSYVKAVSPAGALT